MKYSEIRDKISEIKRVDLKIAKIEYLREKIDKILIKCGKKVPILLDGEELYRVVNFKDKPLTRKKISYPSPEDVTEDQRANRAGQNRFYCSISKGLAILEKAKEGDFITISKWRVKKKFFTNDVRNNRFKNAKPSLQNKIILQFINDEFLQEINKGEEYRYKISIAISESLAGVDHNITDENGITSRFGGLIYPSIHTGGDNLVLFPETVDSCLELINIEYGQVEKVNNPEVIFNQLDFANTVGGNGEIEWKGRRAEWKIEKRQSGLISYNMHRGGWSIRNYEGLTIDEV